MQLFRAAILFALALLPGLASAEISNSVCRATGNEMCSKTFYGTGLCDGIDKLPVLETPWEARPIKIVGVSISVEVFAPHKAYYFFRKKPQVFSFSGNSHSPDVMIALAGEGTTPNPFFPEGKFFRFPGKVDATDPHIDLHVRCSGAKSFGAHMVVYYTFDDGESDSIATR